MSHFLFEPIEFLEKLAAIIPRPAVNLLLYHGVLAPPVAWRSAVIPRRHDAGDEGTLAVVPSEGTGPRAEPSPGFLAHLGLPSDRVRADPAQPPPSAAPLFADAVT
jgi:hypothetical protein